jgi:hypothetical protein
MIFMTEQHLNDQYKRVSLHNQIEVSSINEFH